MDKDNYFDNQICFHGNDVFATLPCQFSAIFVFSL